MCGHKCQDAYLEVRGSPVELVLSFLYKASEFQLMLAALGVSLLPADIFLSSFLMNQVMGYVPPFSHVTLSSTNTS